MADVLTPRQRYRCMRANRSKNTSIQVMLRKALFARGWRYRIHVPILPGCPDIVFLGRRVAVFVDGDFWHGYRLPAWEHKLSAYWKSKIKRNRDRDRKNHRKLRESGWKVVRVWEHEIRRNLDRAACNVEAMLSR